MGEDWGELPVTNPTGEQKILKGSQDVLEEHGSSNKEQTGGEQTPPPPPLTTIVVEEERGGYDTIPTALSRLSQPDIRSFLQPSGLEGRADRSVLDNNTTSSVTPSMGDFAKLGLKCGGKKRFGMVGLLQP